jgi:hypothetical protein
MIKKKRIMKEEDLHSLHREKLTYSRSHFNEGPFKQNHRPERQKVGVSFT